MSSSPATPAGPVPGTPGRGPTPDATPGGAPATKGQGSKISDALGFGGGGEGGGGSGGGSPSSGGVPVSTPGVPPTREVKRAFGERLGATEPIVDPAESQQASAPWVPSSRTAAAATAMVTVPAGEFLFGEERKPEKLHAFEIDRDPVTNGEYEVFVLATGHRPPLYWKGPRCPDDLREHPVVGVDYYDAMAYARWAGKDLPYEDEWERAARGTDGRLYPWGDEPDLAANTARTGLKMTVPVGFFPKNVSPVGCRDLVGNAWELTHTPAPGGGVVVRGGSWFDFALYAKTTFRLASRPESRNGTIGFRCVKRPAPRAGVPRSVPEGDLDAAIATRRGKGEVVDASRFSAERRDLVPDVRRLRQAATARDEDAAAERAPAAFAPNRPTIKRAFAGRVAPASPPPAPTPTATPVPPTPKAAFPAPAPRPAPTPLPFPPIAPVSTPSPAAAATSAAVPVPPVPKPAFPAAPTAPPVVFGATLGTTSVGATAPPPPPPTPPAAAVPAAARPPSSGPAPVVSHPTPAPVVPAGPGTAASPVGAIRLAPPTPAAVPMPASPVAPDPLSFSPSAPRPAAAASVPPAPPVRPLPPPPLRIVRTAPPMPEEPPSSAAPADGTQRPALTPTPTPTPTPAPAPRADLPPTPAGIPGAVLHGVSPTAAAGRAGPLPTAPFNPLAPAGPGVPPPPLPRTAPAPVAASPARPAPLPARSPGPITTPAPSHAPAPGSRSAASPALPYPSVPPAPAPTPTPADHPSPLRLALLVMAFLAAAVGVVVLLTKLAGSGRGGASEDEAARLQLPPLVASDRDHDVVPVSPLVEEGSAFADLGRGGVLLVFARPTGAAGIDTAQLAVDLHRRLRDRAGLRVALVVPADGVSGATGPPSMGEALRRLGVTGDLFVVVDPTGDDGLPGRWRRTHWKVDEENAAVLLEDGVEILRVTPPTTSAPLTRAQVAWLGRRAGQDYVDRATDDRPPAPAAAMGGG